MQLTFPHATRQVEFAAAEIKKQQKVDVMSDPAQLRRLRTACEKAKRALSFNAKTEIVVDSLHASIEVTRPQFEKWCNEYFRSCLEPVNKCLLDAKLAKEDIDEIIMIGGSTRIPRVQQLVSQ